jgi:hypothetical protein
MTDYWARFLSGASKILLYEKPGVEYNMMDLENFVFKQAGNAIDACIQIMGVDAFLETLRKRGVRPNPKYEQLLTQYRNRTKHD